VINPLSISSDGYLKRGAKAALCIAVAGYLNFTTPVVPSGDTGGGGKSQYTTVDQARIQKIQRDDEDIIIILKAFSQII
jgi:hypothetical protein